MSRLILLFTALALASCMVQPPSYVRYDAAPVADDDYGDIYANHDLSADHAANGAYVERARHDDDVISYVDVPAYIEYPAYYSALWPVYGSYYYPYVSPFFYPGVTFFPNGLYGAGYGGFGWGISLGFGFSPWRSAYWDNYYNWGYWRHNYPHYAHYYPNRRFGSARNEAARMASIGRNRYGHNFAGVNSVNSHAVMSSLPSWGGQRADRRNSRFTQENVPRRRGNVSRAAGVMPNGSVGVPGNRSNARFGDSRSRDRAYPRDKYASPKTDYYVAPRAYMSNWRGSFPGPYAGGSPRVRGGEVHSPVIHSAVGARAAPRSSRGGSHERGPNNR